MVSKRRLGAVFWLLTIAAAVSLIVVLVAATAVDWADKAIPIIGLNDLADPPEIAPADLAGAVANGSIGQLGSMTLRNASFRDRSTNGIGWPTWQLEWYVGAAPERTTVVKIADPHGLIELTADFDANKRYRVILRANFYDGWSYLELLNLNPE